MLECLERVSGGWWWGAGAGGVGGVWVHCCIDRNIPTVWAQCQLFKNKQDGLSCTFMKSVYKLLG